MSILFYFLRVPISYQYVKNRPSIIEKYFFFCLITWSSLQRDYITRKKIIHYFLPACVVLWNKVKSPFFLSIINYMKSYFFQCMHAKHEKTNNLVLIWHESWWSSKSSSLLLEFSVEPLLWSTANMAPKLLNTFLAWRASFSFLLFCSAW